MTDQNEIINRGNCFKLIAACFYEPDRALFIEEQVCENLKDLLKNWASGAAKAASDMDLSLSVCDQDQLSIDHAALFVGPFELLAAPYGSIYREKNRQVMGESTIEVLRSYQDAGLTVDIKEPPDHIAIELEFMYYLCTREAAAVADGNGEEADRYREMQNCFYQSALPWIPQFCDSIRKGTENPFYTGLADCLDRLMVTCEQIYAKTAQAAA
jgi:TorA maturation chaperone TorD